MKKHKLPRFPTMDELTKMLEQNPKSVLMCGNVWLPVSEAILYRKIENFL